LRRALLDALLAGDNLRLAPVHGVL
jgi:hypothetical protein